MRVIITGSGGFLGQALIKRLLQKNVFICGITSNPKELKEKFSRYFNIRFYEKDAIQNKKLLLEKEDILINCAFPRNAKGEELASGLKYIETLLIAATEQKIKAVVNISSQSIYDPQRSYFATENSPLYLNTPYAVGKYASELLTESICNNIFYTNLRMASLIGPNFEQRVVNKLVRLALKNKALTVKKNNQNFGFLDIEDAVEGITCILFEQPHKWKKVYNIGGDFIYTLPEIAAEVSFVINERYGYEIEINVEDDAQCMNSALDSSLLKKDMGFMPKITLRKSIDKIIDAME